MESTQASIEAKRYLALQNWLCSVLGQSINTVQSMPGDASFRRYYRINVNDHSYVVMDAPPPENCQQFSVIAKVLKQLGLRTPTIFAIDQQQGFLLLSDFGDNTYQRILRPENADQLYQTALAALCILQGCPHDEINPPHFSENWMLQEWSWHQTWFIEKWLQLTMPLPSLTPAYAQLIQSASLQPQVFIHRDFHSANLMHLSHNEVGILDFQDAFIGPVTYDLVSLLRDCYIDWPEKQVYGWVNEYYHQLSDRKIIHVDADTFNQWFDFMGIERHLKALMTFARKAVRDGNNAYLKFIPRTLTYITTVTARYPTLSPLYDFYKNIVTPVVKQKLGAQ